MRILFLEDYGGVSEHLIGILQDLGHTVIDCFNVNDAQSVWEDRATAPVDCLIVDLNMSGDGLTKGQIQESCSGVLTGWIWLRDHVLVDSPKFAERIIIFSDYLPLFRELVVPSTQYDGICLVPKRGLTSVVEVVVRRVTSIAGDLAAK